MLWILLWPLATQAASSAKSYAARFAQAQSLARRGDDAAASKLYEALIKQDPGLPQAYNNLAAIKARHGHYKQAQALLEQALRSDPVYATVYENLSAIYVEMARDSYGKALRLDTPQQAIALRELDKPKPAKPAPIQVAAAPEEKPHSHAGKKAAADESHTQKPAPVTASQATATKPAPAPADDSAATTAAAKPQAKQPETKTATDNPTVVAKSETPAVETKPAQPSPNPQADQTIADKSVMTLTQPAPDETMPAEATPSIALQDDTTAVTPTESKPVATNPSEATAAPLLPFNKEDVITNLQGWAAAWSGKAVDLYLDFYAKDYAPSGMTHPQWVAQRRQRLLAPKWIRVELRDFEVDAIKDDEARVRLTQVYKANNYHDRTRKEFRLRHTPDGWRIVEEKTIAMTH